MAANCLFSGEIATRVLDDQTVAQPWYASMIHLASAETSYSNGNAIAIRVLSGSSSIEETFNNTFNVYPNPATDVINVEFSDNFSGTVSVLDIAGKEVSTSAFSGLQHTLSTSALTNGVYFVKVNDGTASQVERIVVKK